MLFSSVALISLVGASCSIGEINSGLGLGPNPDIVGLHASEHYGFDYSITVEVTVQNNGKSGYVEVTAELQDGGYWKKSSTVYIAGGQTETVNINFPEAAFLEQGLSGFQYSANAKPQ